ncbi:hypothetical protein F4553_003172 [Allocatelliglobosispora scoriae]|uniref:Uncharacterized protein n=1 Tax=Allocatelliglobosispora scoriae TaxID=643052 RepID=A0A841BSA3_9ACTN|nr:hypothetical protein [Allocatelliglobosispora scoriae]MBB5869793.1 hypothetical protein [Allocatelliglobosispora scoriae]
MQRFSLLLEDLPDRPQCDAVAEQFGDTGMRYYHEAGIGLISVERKSSSLGEAITEAIRDVETIGLRPVGVAQDDEARPVVATAACLALELRALALTRSDRTAITQLVNA